MYPERDATLHHVGERVKTLVWTELIVVKCGYCKTWKTGAKPMKKRDSMHEMERGESKRDCLRQGRREKREREGRAREVGFEQRRMVRVV